MTLSQIKQAVDSGLTVHWATPSYTVIKDNHDRWLIKCTNGHCIGLTWLDGVTLNGNEDQFYIGE